MNPYIPQPIPFYSSNDRQHFRQQYCANAVRFDNMVLFNNMNVRLPNFQVIRTDRGASPTQLFIMSVDTDTPQSIINPALLSVVDIDSPLTKQAITWNLQWVLTIGSELEASKHYYIQVSDGVETWYSEAFQAIYAPNTSTDFPPSCTNIMRLEWSDTCANGIGTTYHPGTAFTMFLDADPGKPTWVYEEDGDKNADGDFTPSFQRMEKEYELEFLAPEYVIDALAHTALFDTVEMYFPNGEGWVLNSPRIEVDWQAGGCVAIAKLKFKRDPIIKTGCC